MSSRGKRSKTSVSEAENISPSHPKVAIILPVLNGMPYLKDTLDSIQAQTEQNWTCYVMDRGSQDRSFPFVESLMDKSEPRIQLSAYGGNGVTSNWCYGFGMEHIKSTYTLFLKVGDCLHPNALERLVAALESDPGHVGAYGQERVFNVLGKPLTRTHEDIIRGTLRGVRHKKVMDWEGPADWHCFLYRNPAPMSATLFLRWVALEAGGVHPMLTDHLDWDLFLRMSRFGSFVSLNETVVNVREAEEDPTLARIRRSKAAAIVRDEAAQLKDLTEPQRRLAEMLREVGGLLT